MTTRIDASTGGQREPVGDATCVHCGYSLRTLARDTLCPECGRPVADSLLTLDEARLVAREDRILARAERYRRNRSAAGCLSVMSVLGVGPFLIVAGIAPQLVHHPLIVWMAAFGLSGACFWAAIAYANQCRADHAVSVERFRRLEARRTEESARRL